MALFSKDKMTDMLGKAQNFAKETTQKASDAVSDKIEQFQEDSAQSKMSRDEMMALYNEKNGNGDIRLTIEVENMQGPSLGSFKVKVDDYLFKLDMGESLTLPMFSGNHQINISYVVVKSQVSFDFKQNTILRIGNDTVSNTMKTELLDENGNPLEGSENAVQDDKASGFFKKISFTEKDTDAHSDADMRIFGSNGQMYLYPDKVIIEREGISAKTSMPFAKAKTIPMDQISRVLTADTGVRGEGYIKICDSARNVLVDTFVQIEMDTNAVILFDNNTIKMAKEYIQEHISKEN
ncbi:MAG: hypothetical protein K6E16_11295 [Lachnospiraceae bacterium]|nr:hypothetical protein [Lachnospiraceae bacterium]